jgi:hypothetical protein
MAKARGSDKTPKRRINAFLKVDGIDGPSEQKGFEKEFPVNSYGIGMAGVGHVPGKETAARREPKPTCGDLSVTIIGSHKTHEMFRRLLGGAVIPKIALTRPAMDGGGKKDHAHTLENVVITHADLALDEDGNCLVTLVFEYAVWRLEVHLPDGTSGGAVQYNVPTTVLS